MGFRRGIWRFWCAKKITENKRMRRVEREKPECFAEATLPACRRARRDREFGFARFLPGAAEPILRQAEDDGGFGEAEGHPGILSWYWKGR